MQSQRKIFISYRRADNADFTDRIRDHFILRYGRDNVFMDFDSIPPGVRFADHIRSSMKQSDAVIAVMGPRWLELLQERAKNFEDDFVRIELSLALELGKPITPICINGAPIPPRNSLPSDLRPLLDYNIAFLDRTNFYERIERIITSVEAILVAQQPLNIQNTQDDLSNSGSLSDYSDADITYYTEKISLDPQNAFLYFRRSLARRGKGDDNGAIADLNEAIRLDSKFADDEASSRYADTYYKGGVVRQNESDNDGAIIDVSDAIRLNQENINAYNKQGLTLYNARQYEHAISEFSEALRLGPRNAILYYNRAIARKANGDLKGATADFNNAIRLDPKQLNFYIGRAELREYKKDLDGAIADYTEALRLDPQNITAFNRRAMAKARR